MSDRATVHLTVLDTQSEATKAFFDCEPGDSGNADHGCKYFQFDGVNYGNLDFLDNLRDAGIAYDSDWGAGNEYLAGCHSCRFTPAGDCIEKHVYDGDAAVPLDAVMHILHDHAALVKCIEACHEHVYVLPWDNQEEYGKIYRAKRLIS